MSILFIEDCVKMCDNLYSLKVSKTFRSALFLCVRALTVNHANSTIGIKFQILRVNQNELGSKKYD